MVIRDMENKDSNGGTHLISGERLAKLLGQKNRGLWYVYQLNKHADALQLASDGLRAMLHEEVRAFLP